MTGMVTSVVRKSKFARFRQSSPIILQIVPSSKWYLLYRHTQTVSNKAFPRVGDVAKASN